MVSLTKRKKTLMQSCSRPKCSQLDMFDSLILQLVYETNIFNLRDADC